MGEEEGGGEEEVEEGLGRGREGDEEGGGREVVEQGREGRHDEVRRRAGRGDGGVHLEMWRWGRGEMGERGEGR